MTNSSTPSRSRFVPVFGALLLGAALACASTSTPAAPAGPVELNGTSWKLVTYRGKLDGRVVEFKKEKGQYVGSLKEKGLQLRDLPGASEGMHIFEMQATDVNTYHGLYRSPNADGSLVEREVNISVSGNTMTWNLESVSWERVE